MAYQIIKSINPVLLCLDSESKVSLIVKVALKLGNSVRPIDSATAAYMLKISKLSPVIKDILCDYCKVEDNVMEATTLQLVLLLYRKLQVCIRRDIYANAIKSNFIDHILFFQEALVLAKKNIGMAIVKNSLYGYLFCMRSLLLDCDLT